MNSKGRHAILALLVVLSALPVLARQLELGEYRAVMESLSGVHPRFREYWLKARGFDVADFMPSGALRPESVGLRLVGKYGRGPSVEVTGRDTLIALTLGSEVALLDFANPALPRVLSEIQLDFIPAQAALAGSLLVVGGRGMDIWNVADPTRPTRVSRFPIGAGDFCVQDSLVCFIQTDTFRVYSIGDPASPRLLGFYRDGGYVLTASGNTVVAGHPSVGLFFVDISDPAQPRRVGTFSGDYPLSASARGNLCCASFESNAEPYPIRFVTLDISNPASVRQLARIDSAGGYDICIWDTLAFASGRDRAYAEEFQVISIADSAHPRILGRSATPYDNWGVWACPPRNRAYVADRGKGLSVFDISNLSQPVRDTAVMVADLAHDVVVDGSRAYVADYVGGLRVLDVSDHSRPLELGGYDSTESTCWSVAARDSFAFVGWRPNPYFRSMLVSDPTRPRQVGSGIVQTIPEDMVLRDTLVYLAGRLRFNVVNVARPREPELVGSCVLQNTGMNITLRDSLAYVAALNLVVVNVTRPDSPQIVFQGLSGAEGLDVVDTVVYLAHDGLKTASIADPAAPYLLDSISVVDFITDVVVVDTLAILSGRKLYIFGVADPRSIRLLGTWTAPGWVYRLLYQPPYLYAACWDAGVCILETTETGVSEMATRQTPEPLVVSPSVTTGRIRVRSPCSDEPLVVKVHDIAGKEVRPTSIEHASSSAGSSLNVDLAGLPDGVYVLRGKVGGEAIAAKVIKTARR